MDSFMRNVHRTLHNLFNKLHRSGRSTFPLSRVRLLAAGGAGHETPGAVPTRMRGLGGGAVVGLGDLLARGLPGIFRGQDQVLVALAVDEKATGDGHGRDVGSKRVLARRAPPVEADEGPVLEHGLEPVHVGVEVQDLVPGGVDDPEIVEDEGC